MLTISLVEVFLFLSQCLTILLILAGGFLAFLDIDLIKDNIKFINLLYITIAWSNKSFFPPNIIVKIFA